MRIGKRYLFWSSAFLVAGSLAGAGSLLLQVRAELLAARQELADLREESASQEAELAHLDRRLGRLGADSDSSRAAGEQARARIEARLTELQRGESGGEPFRARLGELEAQVQTLAGAAAEHERLLQAARGDADVSLRYRELMSPTVRVQSRSEVGSGTILLSKQLGRGRARTYVLTAYHIVEEAEGEAAEGTLEVDFYAEGELVRSEVARLVAKEVGLDLALLEVRGYHVYETKARIPARERLAEVRPFSKVYAIGCPLGYSPLPTSGELTSKDKELDGNRYWMINAPTIFGNSGGGIYLAGPRVMIGVLSRISAYKNMIDVAVPHMGLVTPMNQVYDWLDQTRYAFVYQERLTELRAELRETTSAQAAPAGASKSQEASPLPASSRDEPKASGD